MCNFQTHKCFHTRKTHTYAHAQTHTHNHTDTQTQTHTHTLTATLKRAAILTKRAVSHSVAYPSGFTIASVLCVRVAVCCSLLQCVAQRN